MLRTGNCAAHKACHGSESTFCKHGMRALFRVQGLVGTPLPCMLRMQAEHSS